MHFRKITIIGVGLLGGSIGLAARRRRLAREVAGFVRRAASLKDCEKAGAVDYATTDLLAAVSNADLVILCTPLSQMRPRVLEMLPALKRGAIVTDVGSVKAGVVRELESLVRKSGAHFVGSHPMAGAEKTGVRRRASGFVCERRLRRDADRKIRCGGGPQGGGILEIARRADFAARAGTARFARQPLQPFAACRGCDADESGFGSGAARISARLCANGFRDTTRIASGSPEMWRDIALANRRNLCRALDAFISELQKFQRALKTSDADAVSRFLETAKARRDNWCAISTSPE